MSTYKTSSQLTEFSLWNKVEAKRIPLSFDLEITARCNNNCRHCYINLPAGDRKAKEKELTLEEINRIADQAVALGALWVLVTGGEPLLRPDFPAIYSSLKKKGLLVSVFTNACLINEQIIQLFKEYPPRDIEVTVYGVTRETYEKVTDQPGSYALFQRGLNLLLNNGIKVRLKAVATRANIHEFSEIVDFCRKNSWDYFRFDPLLHLRYDNDEKRNQEIREERLTPDEIVTLEENDIERSSALDKNCNNLIQPDNMDHHCNHLFHCGVGNKSFTVSYDGFFRPCADLWHPECIYNLREGSLEQAWKELIPVVREMTTDNVTYLETCQLCTITNLCMNCGAHAYLETGSMDGETSYFCQVAHARAESLLKRQ